mmetsp:Transcript_54419/g.97256  ORF Transcript_54419/g.97256 Transcript_54419/m.97256 type:complete len:109 (-) Transcript_54419:436-762(-)
MLCTHEGSELRLGPPIAMVQIHMVANASKSSSYCDCLHGVCHTKGQKGAKPPSENDCQSFTHMLELDLHMRLADVFSVSFCVALSSVPAVSLFSELSVPFMPLSVWFT